MFDPISCESRLSSFVVFTKLFVKFFDGFFVTKKLNTAARSLFIL